MVRRSPFLFLKKGARCNGLSDQSRQDRSIGRSMMALHDCCRGHAAKCSWCHCHAGGQHPEGAQQGAQVAASSGSCLTAAQQGRARQ